jgi:hypothetical protein
MSSVPKERELEYAAARQHIYNSICQSFAQVAQSSQVVSVDSIADDTILCRRGVIMMAA